MPLAAGMDSSTQSRKIIICDADTSGAVPARNSPAPRDRPGIVAGVAHATGIFLRLAYRGAAPAIRAHGGANPVAMTRPLGSR